MNLANTAQGIFARVPPISCLDSQQDIIRYLVQNSGLLQLFIRVRSAILFISFWAGVIIAVGKKSGAGVFDASLAQHAEDVWKFRMINVYDTNLPVSKAAPLRK
jgi:hypothetical protein